MWKCRKFFPHLIFLLPRNEIYTSPDPPDHKQTLFMNRFITYRDNVSLLKYPTQIKVTILWNYLILDKNIKNRKEEKSNNTFYCFGCFQSMKKNLDFDKELFEV